MSSFSALIAGVVVSLLVVVVLLSLMVGVLFVVLRARRKMKLEAGQSHSKAEDNLHEGEDNINMYQNVPSEPTPTSGHSGPDYSTAADAFINPASATASFKTHMYDCGNEIDQGPTDVAGRGVYEEARVEWGGGGSFEKPVKGASEEQEKSSVRINVNATGKLEDLYAEPNKVKKKVAKKDSQVSRTEEAAAPSNDLYAQPDMTKKKGQKDQQDVELERKTPQAPLPYKKHKEAKYEGEEVEEDVPELPPTYVADEEQQNNTGNGNGSSSTERRFEYVVLDWHKK